MFTYNSATNIFVFRYYVKLNKPQRIATIPIKSFNENIIALIEIFHPNGIVPNKYGYINLIEAKNSVVLIKTNFDSAIPSFNDVAKPYPQKNMDDSLDRSLTLLDASCDLIKLICTMVDIRALKIIVVALFKNLTAYRPV